MPALSWVIRQNCLWNRMDSDLEIWKEQSAKKPSWAPSSPRSQIGAGMRHCGLDTRGLDSGFGSLRNYHATLDRPLSYLDLSAFL